MGRNLPTLLLTDRIGPELALVAGDRIVTSGDGGVYPPGVPVGVVVDPRADGPVIRLATSPLGGGFVTVESGWLPIPDTQPQALCSMHRCRWKPAQGAHRHRACAPANRRRIDLARP